LTVQKNGISYIQSFTKAASAAGEF